MRQLIVVVALCIGCSIGCSSDDVETTVTDTSATQADSTQADSDDASTPEDTRQQLRPASRATETIAMVAEFDLKDTDPVDVLSPLIGPVAQSNGEPWSLELQTGIHLRSEPDSRTPQQAILSFTMDVSSDVLPKKRTILRVPASFDYGATFIDTVAAAMAVANANENHRPFRLEYRSTSAFGGALIIALDWTPSTVKLVVTAQTPATSLEVGSVNQPARSGEPFESIYGLVVFELGRDDFDFFATRAYGISAGKSQNFKDFHLLPHHWLRLTVTPRLDDELINVGFEVVTIDNRRVALASAPASMRAGEQFIQSVFRMVDNMSAFEEAAAGSSPRWQVPYYYDDPNGGGVVEVIAMGGAGVFSIAYAVETPVNFLMDLDFVDYQGTVTVPDDWDAVDPTCAELGSEPSAQGFLNLRFSPSSTVSNSNKLDGELRGPIWGSVFRAEDVTIVGPNEGAKAVASFHFEDVDMTSGITEQVYRIDTPVVAGDYQILGFMDIDGNADLDDADPDQGDPVMIPIGGYTTECAEQTVIAEFALLLP